MVEHINRRYAGTSTLAGRYALVLLFVYLWFPSGQVAAQEKKVEILKNGSEQVTTKYSDGSRKVEVTTPSGVYTSEDYDSKGKLTFRVETDPTAKPDDYDCPCHRDDPSGKEGIGVTREVDYSGGKRKKTITHPGSLDRQALLAKAKRLREAYEAKKKREARESKKLERGSYSAAFDESDESDDRAILINDFARPTLGDAPGPGCPGH